MSNDKSSIALGWKVALIVLGSIGLMTCLIKIPGFWSGYVLDIVGPAWNYILLRGIYHSQNTSFLFIKFSPEGAVLLIMAICFIIETSQYLNFYNAYFDPYDYLAYVSLLLPVYFLDKHFSSSRGKESKSKERL